MAKEDTIQMTGTVVEILPAAMFRIKLDNVDKVVLGYISGKMRKFDIKVLLGDAVELEFSPYDLNRGRITRRNK